MTKSLKSWDDLKFWKYRYHYNKFSSRICLEEILESKKNVLPTKENWFKAFELCPFDSTKVVILGQDPYHTKGMAHGLAFSVLPHIKKLPPSLVNLLKEYQSDLGYPAPRGGDLRAWAERGVLLLNTIFTVEEGKPLSHEGIGWEKLTYESIKALAERGGVVFLLMGKKAQEYRAACNPAPCICTPHPSPLSRDFAGSKPFTQVNEALKKLGLEPVDWRL